METYRAGVLILGSLLWDNTKGRKAWREHYFGENFYPHIIDIEVPIRNGRFSQNRECPTILLSSEFWLDKKYGTAKFVPFKNQELQFSELICAARDLSEAEDSKDRNFIKGKNNWCIIVSWMNDKIGGKVKSEFLEKWEKVFENEGYNLTDDFLNNFRMESEREKENFITDEGSLNFDWPESLNEFDLILATQTKPRRKPKDQSEYLKPNELASQIFKKPEYFIKNTLNGIITSEDDSIIKILTDNELAIFRANALKDGCNERETDAFINHFLNKNIGL